MSGPRIGPTLEERALAALRREGAAGSAAVGAALGKSARTVSGALGRLVASGRARVVRVDGQARIYAVAEEPKP